MSFAPEAAEQLVALQGYLAQVATPEVAAGYVERIVAHCESFSLFPHGGRARDETHCRTLPLWEVVQSRRIDPGGMRDTDLDELSDACAPTTARRLAAHCCDVVRLGTEA